MKRPKTVYILYAFFILLFYGAVFSKCKAQEIPDRQPRYNQENRYPEIQKPKLKRKDWKAINNERWQRKIERKYMARAEHDLKYRNPHWREGQEKQKIWFYSILIGGQMVANGLDVWYAAQMPI